VVWNLPLTRADEYLPNGLEGGAPLSPDDQITTPKPSGKHAISANDYPPASVRAGEQGEATIYNLIGSDGMVQDARIAVSTGAKRLDEAALRLVRKFQYEPSRINGTPAATWRVVTIKFFLEGYKFGNCHPQPTITAYERRERVAPGEAIPEYERWTLVNEQGKVEDGLLLTERGWMRLDPALLAVMNAKGNYRARPIRCWVYDGVNPMMKG
jgi:TonB family protein